MLRGNRQLRRLSAPAGELQSLLSAIEKVQGEITPEEFVSDFGLLGHSKICHPKDRDPGGGDPVNWFRREARDIFNVARLLEAIDRKDIGAIKGFFEGQVPGFFATVSWPSNPIRTAQEYVVGIINPYLEGIHRQLQVAADGIHAFYKPRALLDLVHWQLAKVAQGLSVVRHCDGCGKMFVSTDPRRQYCPGGKNCSGRHRIKLFRQRQKQRKTRGRKS